MKKIIFRADGNSATGLGHLYRIFALIEIFKDQFEYSLITRNDTTTHVIPESYHFHLIPDSVPTENEAKWLSTHYPPSQYWIIADGYQFDLAYQKMVKAQGYKLLYIDDLCGEVMADVIVNHSLNIKSADYTIPSSAKLALGTGYAILRPAFLEAAKTAREITKTDTAFVCFGGADQFDLTLKATQALLNIPEIKDIKIVIGAAYLHKEILDLAQTQLKITVYRNISEKELLAVMQACNFAIAPASTILYELCAVKMPVLSGYYVQNQKNIYKGALDNKLIFDGGNFETYSIKDFEQHIKTVLTETNYQPWMDAQSNLFDAGIKNRFLELLSDITYRKATADDMLLVFNWANDKLSRENSYFTEPIALETHQNWFEKKLKDPAASIYIAEITGKPAGLIRYELAENNAVVGILIDESFRGKGLASQFLKDTCVLYFKGNKLPVLAYIKQQNTASVRSFEKAGYKLLRTEQMHGADSFVYKLENELI